MTGRGESYLSMTKEKEMLTHVNGPSLRICYSCKWTVIKEMLLFQLDHCNEYTTMFSGLSKKNAVHLKWTVTKKMPLTSVDHQ